MKNAVNIISALLFLTGYPLYLATDIGAVFWGSYCSAAAIICLERADKESLTGMFMMIAGVFNAFMLTILTYDFVVPKFRTGFSIYTLIFGMSLCALILSFRLFYRIFSR